MTATEPLDTDADRSDPQHHRVTFEDELARTWEAISARDRAPDGSFRAPRVLFRCLSDPETPYVLGPATPLQDLSRPELPATLRRFFADDPSGSEGEAKREPGTEGESETEIEPESRAESSSPATDRSEAAPDASEASYRAVSAGEPIPGAETAERAASDPVPEGDTRVAAERAAPEPESEPLSAVETEHAPVDDEGRTDHEEEAAPAASAESPAPTETEPERPGKPRFDALGMAVAEPGNWLPSFDDEFELADGIPDDADTDEAISA